MGDKIVRIQRIAHYAIVERHGVGGMALVYKAQDEQTHQTIALKILYEWMTVQQEAIDRFWREIQVVSQLDHPNIVPILDSGGYDGRPYLVMPYLSGGNLAEYVQLHKQIQLFEILGWLRDVASALDYAHHQNVIHRDIKLENILLDADGRALLADFGMAHIANATRLTMTGTLRGTPRYMSPEQARAGADIDFSTDLYSFAVVAYLLLTGYYPFTADDPYVLLSQHQQEPPPLPSAVNTNLPPQIDVVLQKGLSKSKRNRYSSATEFVQAIEQTLANDAPRFITVHLWQPNPLQNRLETSFLSVSEAIPAARLESTKTSNLTPASIHINTLSQRVYAMLSIIVLFVIVSFVVMGAAAPSLNLTTSTPEPTTSSQVAQIIIAVTEAQTDIPTVTITPSSTPTHILSATFTSTTTSTVSATATPTLTYTATETPTSTPTPSVTSTEEITAIATNTHTATPTSTLTLIDSPFPTWTASPMSVENQPLELDVSFPGVVNNSRGANVRQGAGTKYGIVTHVEDKTELLLIGRNLSATWCQVILSDGRSGWVYVPLIDLQENFYNLPITWIEPTATTPTSVAENAPQNGQPPSNSANVTSSDNNSSNSNETVNNTDDSDDSGSMSGIVGDMITTILDPFP